MIRWRGAYFLPPFPLSACTTDPPPGTERRKRRQSSRFLSFPEEASENLPPRFLLFFGKQETFFFHPLRNRVIIRGRPSPPLRTEGTRTLPLPLSLLAMPLTELLNSYALVKPDRANWRRCADPPYFFSPRRHGRAFFAFRDGEEEFISFPS